MCCDAEDLPMVLSSVLERDGGALGAEGIPEGDAPAAVRLLAPPPRTASSHLSLAKRARPFPRSV